MDWTFLQRDLDNAMRGFVLEIFQPARRDWPAVTCEDGVVTYHALAESVERAARCLHDKGVRHGATVMLILPSDRSQLVATIALLALGATVVPVDAADSVARLTRLFDQCQPTLALTNAAVALTLGACDAERDDELPEDLVSLRPAERDPLVAQPTRSAPAFIRFSSGSTGEPKGVVLSGRAVAWMASSLSRTYAIDAAHRELLIPSMALSDGWQRIAATLFAGGCVTFAHQPPTRSSILEQIGEHAITGFFAPPPLIRSLLVGDQHELRNGLAGCRSIEIGSAPLSASELERFLALARNANVFVHYGLTECSRAVILDARRFPTKLHTVGRPADGVDLKVERPAGGTSASNHGDILLKGPQLADAYWQRADLNATHYHDGWFATGDIGELDVDGFLIFIGRSDDRLNVGGFSFFPAEAEAVLGAVAGVDQYLIAGVTDPRGMLGEVPWAFVVPESPQSWSPQTFLAQARERLPSHMRPRWVEVMPELPVTRSGKPDRRRAVELYGPNNNGAERRGSA